jgi:hypothetical protein
MMGLRRLLRICLWSLFAVFFVALAIYSCHKESWSAGGTILTAGAALAGLFVARQQISLHNSVRVYEFIDTIYNSFLDDDKKDNLDEGKKDNKDNAESLMDFFERIRKGDKTIDVLKDEKNLNKALSLFDDVNLLLRQGLLPRNSHAWEYVASEIQYFALCDAVWTFMETRLTECRKIGFPLNIIPFTGFTELLTNIPKQYQADSFPNISMSYKRIYNEMNVAQNSRIFWRRIFFPAWGNLK